MEGKSSYIHSTLPTGARRGVKPSQIRVNNLQAQDVGMHSQLVIDTDKLEMSEMTEEKLAQMFHMDINDFAYEPRGDRDVLIIELGTPAKMQEAVNDTPELMEYLYTENEEMDTRPQNGGKTVKLRQCPIETDIKELLIVNRLKGWQGSLFTPRIGSKRTTAILNAPSEEEANALLAKGYLARNGKVLPVVHGNSTLHEEDKRTILIVGVSKVSQALRKMKGRLTEIGLLKTLIYAGYPAQSVKLVELDPGRIVHSAYVFMREPRDTQSLRPLKDATSGTTLQWANLENYKKICGKCLSWTEHTPTCPKHERNQHRFATAQDTSGEWDVGNILRNRFRRPRS